MADPMNPWPSGGRSSWTRAPVAWIVDVFEMEKGGHVPVTARRRLKRRVDADDWAPFDEDALIPKQFQPCMPEDDVQMVMRMAMSVMKVTKMRGKQELCPVDTEPEDSEDKGDSAPLTSINRKAQPKRNQLSANTSAGKKQLVANTMRGTSHRCDPLPET